MRQEWTEFSKLIKFSHSSESTQDISIPIPTRLYILYTAIMYTSRVTTNSTPILFSLVCIVAKL